MLCHAFDSVYLAFHCYLSAKGVHPPPKTMMHFPLFRNDLAPEKFYPQQFQ